MARAKVKTSKSKARVKIVRNVEGYCDGKGRFHPIRGADEYDADAVGESGKDEFGYAERRKKKPVKRIVKKTARKNPASFPIGKFVSVDKVRVNRNGTIDVMRSNGLKRATKRPKR